MLLPSFTHKNAKKILKVFLAFFVFFYKGESMVSEIVLKIFPRLLDALQIHYNGRVFFVIAVAWRTFLRLFSFHCIFFYSFGRWLLLFNLTINFITSSLSMFFSTSGFVEL